MKKNSNFSFISDSILRKNLDIVFDHIIELISVSESNKYEDTIISSFRKTIIIYTATIIEAILLWKLKEKVKGNDIELKEDWKYKDVRKIHILKESPLEKIIWCKRKMETEKKKFSKLNLVEINKLCKKYKIITDSDFENVDKVRDLRNRLHIGGLKKIEEGYTKNDLEFVFGVAKRTKELALK
ncbi:MAG: hypothetical protein WA063_00230 [Minisyncoccia bacterium]